MTTRIHANNFATTINGAISNSATSIVLTSVTGFPSIGAGVTCNLTLQHGATIEIVTATALSTNTLTVTRGQEGTSGVAWSDLSSISIRPTADSVDRKIDTAGGATSRKILVSNGTSWGASTETYAVPGTSGNHLVSDGTNWTSAATTSITALGTVITGTWNATIITATYGGSGRASATAFAPIVGGTTSTGAHQSSASGSTGQIYQSAGNAAVPTWSTPTYPSTSPTSGKILQSDGTNIVASTATWPTAATTSKFLLGNGTNYVESTSTIPTSAGATALKHLKSDGTNYVLTTATISDTPSTAGKRLRSDGTNWITSTTTMPDTGTTGKLLRGDGTNYVETTSTFADTYSASVLLYSNGANTVTGLATANSSVLITSAGGVPSLSTALPSGLTATNMTLTTPILGTPTSGALTNCTLIPVAQATGNLPVANLNSGNSASNATFWRGDGNWASNLSAGMSVGSTANPTNMLDVWSTSSGTVTAGLRLTNNTASGIGSGISLDFQPNGQPTRAASIVSTQTTAGNYADLKFYVSNSAPAVLAMTISAGAAVSFASALAVASGGTGTTTSTGTGSVVLGSPRNAWTPVLTFATPGDVASSAITNNSYYERLGDKVTLVCDYTATLTYTTASGNLQMTGVPVASLSGPTSRVVISNGANLAYPAGSTVVAASLPSASSTISFIGSGSSSTTTLTTTAAATTQSQSIRFVLTYFIT